jgi:Tol biopolymer transport system component
VTTATGSANFDVARDGTLVYVAGAPQSNARTLVWVNRQGDEEAIKVPPRAYLYPRLSPDGTRIALDIRDQDNDIWLWHVARETLTRITNDPALDRFPVWTHDGQHVIFSSDRAKTSSDLAKAGANLYSQAADGTGTVEQLTDSPLLQAATAVSPDGTRVIIEQGNKRDLMMLTLDREHRLLPVVQAESIAQNGVISPDGRWLAYESDETGRFEIYVRPYPDVKAGRWQVSTGGGNQPLWNRNSVELFYLTPTGALMSVPISRGTGWNTGVQTKIFERPYTHGNQSAAQTYDVSLDGKRFLMMKPLGDSQQPGIAPTLIVVQNWLEELRQRVTVK